MPTYEYKCDACGHQFDQFQSIKAEPLKKCPACGKAKLRRLIGTGAGLIFKGSGFYITDYRDAAYKEKAKAESGGGDRKEGKDAKSGSDSAAPAAATASGDGKSASAAPATESGTTTASKSEPKAPPKSDKGGSASGKAKSPKND